MTGRFFFSEPDVPGDQEQEIALWDTVKESSDPATIRRYLRSHPRGTFAAMAKKLIAALEKQQEQEALARQRTKKSEEEMRKAREELAKAREAAKAGKRAAPAPVRKASDQSGKADAYQTCGPRGCQWVPAGCHTIRGGGGRGLGGRIVCP
jgi:hypothetical protein